MTLDNTTPEYRAMIDRISAEGRKATEDAVATRAIQGESESEDFMAAAAAAVAADPSRAEEFIKRAFDQGIPDAPCIAQAINDLAGCS